MHTSAASRYGDWVAGNPLAASVVCFVLGGLTTLSFAPFEFWMLAPATAAAMLLTFFVSTPRRAARFGFVFGVGSFLSGTYWIYVSVHVFGQAPLAVALALMFGLVLIMATYLGFVGWAVSRSASGNPWRLALVGPAIWALVEWLRGWFLSGFPWLSFGYGQVDSPLAGWAPVLGIYGVSWMLLVSAAAVTPLIAIRRSAPAALVLAVMPWGVGAILQTEPWTEDMGDPVETTIVQGGVPQDRKWLRQQFVPTLNLYRDALLAARGSDLVVWPEVAIPAVSNQVEDYLALLERDISQRRQTLALGILEPHENGEQVYNSILMLDGRSRQVYRKRHLVPFGEYFPVPDFVREWMRLLSLPNTDMQKGDDIQPLLVTRDGVSMAAAICYEDAYGAEQLYAFPDAALIVNVSNDAWFGESIAPHQHLQVARMRALEVGRPIIRATNNGISAFIDHRGRITDVAPQFVLAELTRAVQPRQGLTPYAATGNLPLLLLLGAIILLPQLITKQRPNRNSVNQSTE